MTSLPYPSTAFELKWALRSLGGRLRGSTRDGNRIFGVGAAKTGTHSIGQMFNDRVKSSHELDTELLIYLHLDREKTGKNDTLRRFLRRRDKARDLKIDVSHLYIYLVDDFEELFPNSLYILTIRYPVDWLRSFIDDSLRRDTSDAFKKFRDYRFGVGVAHPPEEKALQRRGLFTIGGYLNYWREAVESVTEKIPAERLLIVHTNKISEQTAEIARFCGIDGSKVAEERTRSFVNTERFGVLSEIPKEYLDNIVEEICGPTLERYFAAGF